MDAPKKAQILLLITCIMLKRLEAEVRSGAADDDDDDGQIEKPISGSQLEKLKSCVLHTKVEASFPSNETWWYDSQPIFVPLLKHPIAVAYAERTSQVQELVKCATKYKVKISPRSGGHSYEGFCSEDNQLVVDVSRINSVDVDVDSRMATIGAGIRLGRLNYELGIRRMAFPAGIYTTIGMGGHVAAGGLGFLARLYGTSADNVLELEMVDYRGRVLVANNRTNDDLFFALRGGGGGSYGIVTKMKLRIHPNPPLSTAFVLQWSAPIAASDISKVWFRWRPWENMPPEMTIALSFSSQSSLTGLYLKEDGSVGLQRILGESGLLELGPEGSRHLYHHSSANLLEAKAWLHNNMVHYGNHCDYDAYNTPSSFVFKPLDLPPHPTPVHPTWATIQNDTRVNATHSDIVGHLVGRPPWLIHHEYPKHSSLVFEKEFDQEAYQALEEYVSRHDGALAVFMALGGSVATFAEDFNACPHRKQPFWMEFMIPYYPNGTHTPSGVRGQNEIAKTILTAMEPYTNHRSYQGGLDLFWTTDPQIYMPRYYGGNVERLVRTKATYDPRDVFSNQQSTPVAM